MAKNYRASVRAVDTCGDMATLSLTRPDGFEFEAGQWLRLALPVGGGVATKTFTIASAPADELLEITTRLSGSPYKRVLASLGPGADVDLSGPGGRLRLPGGLTGAVFLAGGVGITPVRSMLRDAVGSGRSFSDAVIVYGNRDPSCVAYAEELKAMRPAGVRVVDVFEEAPASWDGARGFITAQIVREIVDPADDGLFFVTGPPMMVEAMRRVLDELGVSDDRRVVESFGPVDRAATDA